MHGSLLAFRTSDRTIVSTTNNNLLSLTIDELGISIDDLADIAEDPTVIKKLKIDGKSFYATMLPLIQEKLSAELNVPVNGPNYMGVEEFLENNVVLKFSAISEGRYYAWLRRNVNRELKLMCERNDIKLAVTRVVITSADELVKIDK